MRSSDSKYEVGDSNLRKSDSRGNGLRRQAGPLTIEVEPEIEEDQMAGKTEAVRNREQKVRQRALRAKQKAEKRPDRDDVARILLHWFVVGATSKGREHELDRAEDIVVKRLVDQGFDETASYAVFDALVDKYTDSAWGFRRKTHLLFTPDGRPDL